MPTETNPPTSVVRKKIRVTYFKGNKQLNDFYRSCDIFREDEGLFIEEHATVTVKPKTKINKAWKDKFIEVYTEANAKYGFEVRDFTFTIEL